jgi:hypothetical protein
MLCLARWGTCSQGVVQLRQFGFTFPADRPRFIFSDYLRISAECDKSPDKLRGN